MSRRRLNSDQWRAPIKQQKASGQSVSAFCREHDLLPKTFWNRRKALRAADQPGDGGLIAVAPPASTASSGPMCLV